MYMSEHDRLAELDDEFAVALGKYLDAYRKAGNSFYMVLQDGETFTGLHGCSIIRCPDAWNTAAIEHALNDENGWDVIDEDAGAECKAEEEDDRDGLVVLVEFDD
jgi:hypothetical protein